VESAKQELEIELAALRRVDPASTNLNALAQGEAKLRQLDALREKIMNPGSGVTLANLRAEVTVAVAASSTAVAQAGAASSTASTYNLAQISLSQADYRRATAEIDRKIAQSYAEEGHHLAYAHDVAKRLGIDISGFTHERKSLVGERDASRSKGDKLGERVADGLIAHNTFNTLATELDHITDPDARRRHIEEMRAQQKIIDERRAAVAAQAELDGRRASTQQGMSPDQAKTYVDEFKNERLQKFDALTRTLKGADKGEAVRPLIAPGARSANERADEIPSAVAALSPEVRAKAQQAAAGIHRAYGNSTGAVSDFAMGEETGATPAKHDETTPAPSKITPARSAEEHAKVEAPKTPNKADTGKGAALT
jgi:hypothetical protein